jgi:hypothetical protein
MAYSASIGQSVPDGFVVETVAEDIEGVVGIRIVNDSTSFLWTLRGEVLVLQNSQVLENSIIDISEEVAQFSDHGMAGLVLDPLFNVNGYIYLLYTADSYYMLHSQSEDYDPELSFDYESSVGRLARHRVDPFPPYTHYEDETLYLLGSRMDNGIPVLGSSHGMGTVEFGSDGTLMISCGDGSVWTTEFNGGPPFPELSFDEQGLDWGIIRPDENIGSFRSQYPSSLNGKILRIDPETGQGVSSNPFYLPLHPDSTLSKVWSLGLRNPFRMCRRPGTGVSDPSTGNPGTFYIGDVGYYSWEEINVATGPGQNFGWPIMEGMEPFSIYNEMLTPHPFYENPSFNGSSCDAPFFYFQDLLVQPKADHSSVWTNPCAPSQLLSDSLLTFVHRRPVFAYTNGWSWNEYLCVTPGYDGNGNAIATPVLLNPEIEGEDFIGFASLGGDFYNGLSFPDEYFGAYFHSDYSGWLKTFWFDESNKLQRVSSFSDDLPPFLCTRFNPYDDCLYGVTADSKLLRIRYADNVPPRAVLTQDVFFGPTPLTVEFQAESSFDPNGDPLSFHWDFGDGNSSESMNISHTYTSPSNDPISYDIVLTVTDTAGNSSVRQSMISLNNTPPNVSITSIADDAMFNANNETEIDLAAFVEDAESDVSELSFSWTITLIHNQHSHPEAIIHEATGSYSLKPISCSNHADYMYSVSVAVTDPQGLRSSDQVFLGQDCFGAQSEVNQSSFQDFKISPNPSSGEMMLTGPFKVDEELNVTLYDSKGSLQLIETFVCRTEHKLLLDFPWIPEGLFFMTIQTQSSSGHLKILIEHP